MSLSRRILSRTPFAVYGFRGALERARFALNGELVRYVAKTASYWEFQAVHSARSVQVYHDGEVWLTVRGEVPRGQSTVGPLRATAAAAGQSHAVAWTMAKKFRRAIHSHHRTTRRAKERA